jgi:uncharacterized MAPEG superfamily protein
MTTLQKMLQVKLEFSVPGRAFALPSQSEAGVRELLSLIHGKVGSGWSQLWFIFIGYLVCAMAPAAVSLFAAAAGGRLSNAEHRFGAEAAKNNGWLKASVRAQAASANAFESFPLFVGALLACTMFKVDAAVVHVHCWLWLVTRLVYLAVYVLQVGPLAEAVSIVRTAVWASSIILLISLLGAAADAQGRAK